MNAISKIFLGAMLLMSIAFYNGYPLVDGDTGSYIYAAFKFSMPPDRSPFYGCFLGIAGFRVTLWLPLLVQNFILSWLIYRFLQLWLMKNVSTVFFISLIALASVFTHVAWITSTLMPDAFTGMLLLAICCYFLSVKMSGKGSIFLVLIFFFVIVHNSHYLILFLFSLILMLHALVKKIPYRFAAIRLFTLSCCCLFFVCSMNLLYTKTFTLSRGGQAYMIAKLGEMGILNAYLDDNCENQHYNICQYKDDIPSAAWEFLWTSGSPFEKEGGWDGTREEYQRIIGDIFITPKYIGMFIGKALVATLRQLTQNFIVYAPQSYKSNPWEAINKYYPHELKEYFYSNQNLSAFKQLSFINYLCLLFFVGSSIWVLFIYKVKTTIPSLIFLYTLAILFIICNAFVTGSLANVLARLEVRVFWVIPFFNLVILLRHIANRYQLKA